MYQTSAIAGCGYVIHQWLTVLGKINVLYNLDEAQLLDITEIECYMSQVNKTIREQVCHVNEADKVLFEKTIGSDTTSALHSHSHHEEEAENNKNHQYSSP